MTIETSVIIPVLNEGKNIMKLMSCIHAQSYQNFELIFVDGGSTDDTINQIERYQTSLPIKILNNSYKTTQYAMNMGIQNALGEYIIRLDAHSFYPFTYFEDLISTLKENTELGNVGGICHVSGKGNVGEAYAKVLSTRFGVGNSKFRISKKEVYVNTVPFGAYRKKTLERIGFYNEKLARNEDFELNLRIQRNGYKILLRPDIVIEYQCRNTYNSIWKHEIEDGIWNTLSFYVAKYTFSVSHFIPLIFVLSLFSMPFLYASPFGFLHVLCSAELILYLFLNLLFSIMNARADKKLFLSSFILYPLHHIGCGIGEFLGIFMYSKIKKKGSSKKDTCMKLGFVGYYGDDNTPANGQTIRTKVVTNEIIKKGFDYKILSYHAWKRYPISVFAQFTKLFFDSDVLVLFPDENAVKVMVPLITLFNHREKRRIYYIVIGGWLPSVTKSRKYLLTSLRKLDKIFVQTEYLKKELSSLNIHNTVVFPNFKDMKIIEEEKGFECEPFPLCFASRITAEKGIFELISVLKNINKASVRVTLDIYGSLDSSVEDDFYKAIEDCDFINYKGVYDFQKASEIISHYYMHILPTKYPTEGFPGSILDAFCAGVPSLVSKWDSYADVIEDGVNGLCYEFNDIDDLQNKIEFIIKNPDVVNQMKKNCNISAKKYSPNQVINIVTDEIKRLII
ncbi:MAG: glycosyltransferase [Erysipelotrichaceae bacterium]|nr:glycosyltransferase [Erysipelotrichaceae bacterium]